jgi:hypothetical protein
MTAISFVLGFVGLSILRSWTVISILLLYVSIFTLHNQSNHEMFLLPSPSLITALTLSSLLLLASLVRLTAADTAGYYLPSGGVASTTQFYLGPELNGGTACGVKALPNGQSTSGRQGGGPGHLYVRRASLLLFLPSHCPFPISGFEIKPQAQKSLTNFAL